VIRNIPSVLEYIADVAQVVEQRIENPCVTGSTPVFGTKFKGAQYESHYVQEQIK
jgi:hypothetical protein